jgi:hypothetical protein
MENKKLLKYLLKDLSELDEMFAEKGKNSFDELEIEFIQNRVTGAKRLVELFLEKENNLPGETKTVSASVKEPELQKVDTAKGKPENQPEVKAEDFEPARKSPGVWFEESAPEVVQEVKPENHIEEKTPEVIVEEKVHVVESKVKEPEIAEEKKVEIREQKTVKSPKQTVNVKVDSVQQELQMDDEEPVDIHSKRLGDSFSKEKSVNDIMSDDSSKLEHKLSNRPVSSIQSAIGINDRFQYIRELFEGSADNFVKTVADLDSMNDIKEAVDYLQSNFKWKKNDTSLKFVNLIKRRFPNE